MEHVPAGVRGRRRRERAPRPIPRVIHREIISAVSSTNRRRSRIDRVEHEDVALASGSEPVRRRAPPAGRLRKVDRPRAFPVAQPRPSLRSMRFVVVRTRVQIASVGLSDKNVGHSGSAAIHANRAGPGHQRRVRRPQGVVPDVVHVPGKLLRAWVSLSRAPRAEIRNVSNCPPSAIIVRPRRVEVQYVPLRELWGRGRHFPTPHPTPSPVTRRLARRRRPTPLVQIANVKVSRLRV